MIHSKISAVVTLLHITGSSRLLTVLNGEKKAIFTAASLATQIVDYLHGLQPKHTLCPDHDAPPDRPPGGGPTATSTPEGPR